MGKIHKITGYELLDSRGYPTVGVKVTTKDRISGFSIVPSGKSTGKNEALELRDNDPRRFFGHGVKKAIANIEGPLFEALIGKDVTEQRAIDQIMIDLDGTDNKSILGGNAILGISLAVARCAANYKDLELYKYLETDGITFPTPMINIINGGVHASNNILFQELMICPHGFDTFAEKIRAGSEIFHCLEKILKKKNLCTLLGDEGGFAPNVKSLEQALELIVEAIDKSHFLLKDQITIAIDCAASSFYQKDGYFIEKNHPEKGMRSPLEQINYLKELSLKFPIHSIEDGLDENDWAGWKTLTKECKNTQIVGDDIFVTNKNLLQKGIDSKIANCILIKLNQIGTLTETIDTINLAKKHNYGFIISHRSGETEDTFIADLSLATNALEIKTGSMSRSERIAKYNRLLKIEKNLG
jgi:enolase